MEIIVIVPVLVTVAGVIIAIMALLSPTYFGIKEGSINIATVWSPITAAIVGVSIFLSA